MKKTFFKMHGLGNDFVVFDGRDTGFDLPAATIQALGDRRTGIGFDQMVIIDPPRSPDTDAFLRIYNADGSQIGACGNATRCIGHKLMQETCKNHVRMQTFAAYLEAVRQGDDICVDMGEVRLEWHQIPLSHAQNTLSLPATWGDLNSPVAVNVGNPHAVFFVPNVMKVDIESLGPKVENHILFPERTNVEFAQVLGPDKIRMRVWERGAGVTRACGTGACAVAVAGVRRGLTGRKITVVLDGGELAIEWRESDNHVLMTGAVAEVYRGEIIL